MGFHIDLGDALHAAGSIIRLATHPDEIRGEAEKRGELLGLSHCAHEVRLREEHAQFREALADNLHGAPFMLGCRNEDVNTILEAIERIARQKAEEL